MVSSQQQYGQIANYNISPATRGNGASSGLEVDSIGNLLVNLNAASISIPTVPTGYTTQIDYNGGTSPIYIGLATPGSATSSSNWQIKMITYDTNGNPIAIQYAQGVNTFSNVWNNRASYSYS